ncbi:MAG: hypothetical protein KatS3mg040_0513 [Candidatus Kapaibacterium sp.]|nr:MAG: hypothetical protein KatS3mg040_0513 [Candidatus Kapabacteria bacterium]
MRWMVGLLPAIVWAQVEITIPDTLPSQLLRWQGIQGDVLLRTRGAVRILVCLEPLQMDTLCTPFARQPITLIADSLRLPFATLIGELLASAEPFPYRSSLPQGQCRICVRVVDANDSSREVAPVRCRTVWIRGVPHVEATGATGTVRASDTALLHFQWTIEAPAGAEGIEWELRIAPRRLGQSAWYALMVNAPIVQCTRDSGSQTAWECSLHAKVFAPKTRYVWGIFTRSAGEAWELVSPVREFVVEQ